MICRFTEESMDNKSRDEGVRAAKSYTASFQHVVGHHCPLPQSFCSQPIVAGYSLRRLLTPRTLKHALAQIDTPESDSSRSKLDAVWMRMHVYLRARKQAVHVCTNVRIYVFTWGPHRETQPQKSDLMNLIKLNCCGWAQFCVCFSAYT